MQAEAQAGEEEGEGGSSRVAVLAVQPQRVLMYVPGAGGTSEQPGAGDGGGGGGGGAGGDGGPGGWPAATARQWSDQ